MSPSPTNTLPAPPINPGQGDPNNCQTAQVLPSQVYNGPDRTGPPPMPWAPQLPTTGKLPPTGYTPTTSLPDTGSAQAGGPARQQSLMSLVQPGIPGNLSNDPLFRLTYGGSLGLPLSGDQKDPLPLYNPFAGAKS